MVGKIDGLTQAASIAAVVRLQRQPSRKTALTKHHKRLDAASMNEILDSPYNAPILLLAVLRRPTL
jgi:hypothetical protein